jgi:hypothetical protein
LSSPIEIIKFVKRERKKRKTLQLLEGRLSDWCGGKNPSASLKTSIRLSSQKVLDASNGGG